MNERIVKVHLGCAQNIDKIIDRRKRDKPGTKYEVDVTVELSQAMLKVVANSHIGKHAVKLHCHPDYDDDCPVLDFSLVKLPELLFINVQNQAMKSIHFTKENTPKLKELSLELGRELEYINLDLADLKEISFRFVTLLDATGFGKSMSSCPSLQRIICYKLMGLNCCSKAHYLVLPQCEYVEFHRSDDLTHLQIWAPKLVEIGLISCYDLEKVNLLDKKPSGFNSEEYSFHGKPSIYTVDMLNTTEPRGNILNHKRCHTRGW